MKTNLRFTPLLVVFALAAAFAAPLPAAGLLKQRHASVTYDFFVPESAGHENGGGFSLLYNHPFNEVADLGLTYSHLSYDAARPGDFDMKKQRFMVYGTGVGELDKDVPFVSFGLGWGRDAYGPVELESLLYSFRIGAEWNPNDTFALTVYAAWMDSFNNEVDGALTYGASFHHDLGQGFSGLVALEGDDHFNVKFSLGAVFRF